MNPARSHLFAFQMFDRLQDLRLDHIYPRQCRFQRFGGLFQNGECLVVAGDDGLEIEEGFRCVGGSFHIHRVVPAGTQDADIGMVQVIENLHIRHDIRIPGKVDRVAVARDHVAGLGSGITRSSIPEINTRRMHRIYHRDPDLPQRNRPAFAEPDRGHLFGAAPIFGKLVDGCDRYIEFACQAYGIAGMIAVTVADQDMRRTLDRFGFPPLWKDGISVQPRVHQKHLIGNLDAKAGMSKPDDFHVSLLQ